MRIGRISETRRAAAKRFRMREQLRVNFESDDRFVLAHDAVITFGASDRLRRPSPPTHRAADDRIGSVFHVLARNARMRGIARLVTRIFRPAAAVATGELHQEILAIDELIA